MIINTTLGDVENVTIATFGNGTMRVTSGEAQDKTYKGLFLGDSEEPVKLHETKHGNYYIDEGKALKSISLKEAKELLLEN